MKKQNDGLCSILEYNQFKSCIFDAVNEWINYCDSDPDMCVAIDKRNLSVEVCSKKEAKICEWIPMEVLAPDGEADADTVLDLADRFCFVR